MIKIRYSAIDGYGKTKTFKTLNGARKYAQRMVGQYPEMGSTYAVSGDGVGKIVVLEGTTLAELFGDVEGVEPPGFDNPGRYDEYKADSGEFDPGADYDNEIPF